MNIDFSNQNNSEPLAERLRPHTLDDLVGQSHLTGEAGILRNSIVSGQIPSMILWGPPGVGKTSLASIIANTVKMPFVALSAISSGVKEVREVISKARYQSKSVVFIDEIHRFNKNQQDALLGAVEKGYISLIGATTENPSFEVNAALISRCQVYRLKALKKEDQIQLLEHAIEKDSILKTKNIQLKEKDALLKIAGGDARKLLNLLEIVVNSFGLNKNIVIEDAVVKKVAQQKVILYDKNGDQHYDIVSAMIKSIRGSDPNAAVYWMARMLEGGEDVKFIARRLIISASEDVGLANPEALNVANACFQSVNVVGMPEAEIILSQCICYLAASPKSNATYLAIKKARQEIKSSGALAVPLALRNANSKLMKAEGYGKDYKYSHDFPYNFAEQEFMPSELKEKKFYDPGNNKKESDIRKLLKFFWKDKYGY